MTIKFEIICQWCGALNRDKVPLPSKGKGFQIGCNYCHKFICDFYLEDEKISQ